MSIIDYAENQMERFDTAKFNPADSLVLSQFAYIYFNDVVPGLDDQNASVRIADLLKAEYIARMLHNVRDPKSNHRLLFALGMSPRFRDIRMCCYADSLDVTEQKQFSAVTYLLDDETAYVAYRGTDATFVGWKEDFNMAFILPVPAQQEGICYLNAVAERIPHKLMVGGHSKGGNVAVYSAMGCQPSVGDRIVRVYSHDGPGSESVIEAMGVVNFSDLTEDWLKKAASVLDAIKDIDPETKRFVSGTIKSLVALSVKNLRFPLRKA